MLGIAFTGGDGPSPELCRRLLGERAALIVAADSGLAAAEEAGFRPDWIVGDMDSLDDPGRLDKYPSDRVLRHRADKDYTDTELALKLLWEKGCDETWLAGGGGGRLDHLFAIRSLFERERPPNRWITAAEDLYCLEAAQGEWVAAQAAGELALEVRAGSIVSVFPLGSGPWKAKSKGLKWPLDNVSWDRGFAGISNVAPEGNFVIRAEQGRFMVIVPLEEE
ncbi:thiamine pyrophosphokinase [Spirochaetia bacterium]|nr:thiamine pyrophosphokinase [Spirochaetia bacterium]